MTREGNKKSRGRKDPARSGSNSTPLIKSTAGMTIAEVVKAADAAGMSYGKYVAESCRKRRTGR